ncbi:hypothetical protein D3C86_1479790 [compost metagenome]
MCRPGGPVYDRIICNHALVHTVKSKLLTVVAPESTFADAKLVSVYRRSVYNVFSPIGGHLFLIGTFGYKQIKIIQVGHITGLAFLYITFGRKRLVNQHPHRVFSGIKSNFTSVQVYDPFRPLVKLDHRHHFQRILLCRFQLLVQLGQGKIRLVCR